MIVSFTYSIFVSFGLIIIGSLLTRSNSTYSVAAHLIQGVGAMVLFFQVPIIYIFAAKKDNQKLRWNVRKFVFYLFSWLFYAVAGIIFSGVVFGWWNWIQGIGTTDEPSSPMIGSKYHILQVYYSLVGWIPSLTGCGIMANVLMISGIFADRHINDANGKSSKLSFLFGHFLSLNVLLIIAGAMLGIVAEMTWRQRDNANLAAVEGTLSALLLMAGLFNTHGLGGRILHVSSSDVRSGSKVFPRRGKSGIRSFSMNFDTNLDSDSDDYHSEELKVETTPSEDSTDSWLFFQPFVGGFRFVMLQGITWFIFAVALLLEVAFMISSLMLGFQLFVGVTVVAGSLCMVAEAAVIFSLFVYHQPGRFGTIIEKMSDVSPKESSEPESWLDKQVSGLHGFVLMVILTNIGYVAMIGIFPVFALSGLPWDHVFLHWGFATLSIFLFPIIFAFCKARDSRARRLLKDHAPTSRPNIQSVLLANKTKSGASRKEKSTRNNGQYKKETTHSAAPVVYRERTWRTCMHWTQSWLVNAFLLLIVLVPAFASSYFLVIGWLEAFTPWLIIAVSHIIYILHTYNGDPELTGWRTMNSIELESPVMQRCGEIGRKYFHGSIIKEADLSPDEVYLFGFHPHGILPSTVFWLRCSGVWERAFPGISYSPLSATVMHLVPLLRDLAHWVGGREVSRESVQLTLRSGKNCLIIPGGQAEMMESRSCLDEVVIVTKHAGFVRMAIQEGVKLVPIFSFGEVDLLDNTQWPSVQRWFLRQWGFVVPFSPYGRFYLPIPRSKRVTVVVGKPMTVPHIPNPSDRDIKKILYRYFCEIHGLFHRHKHEAQGPAAAGNDPELIAATPPARELTFLDQHGQKCSLAELKKLWNLDNDSDGEDHSNDRKTAPARRKTPSRATSDQNKGRGRSKSPYRVSEKANTRRTRGTMRSRSRSKSRNRK